MAFVFPRHQRVKAAEKETLRISGRRAAARRRLRMRRDKGSRGGSGMGGHRGQGFLEPVQEPAPLPPSPSPVLVGPERHRHVPETAGCLGHPRV